MRRLMGIVTIFFKRNFKKFIPSIITLVTFIVVLNIVIGIILETTGVMKNSVTENASMFLMEVLLNDSEDEEKIVEMEDEIKKIENVAAICMDVSHPINASSSSSNNCEVFNILGVPQEALQYFDINDNGKGSFFYIEDKFLDDFPVDSEVVFEEGEYYIEDNELNSRLVEYSFQVSGSFLPIGDDFFPTGLALIDEETALKIAKGMSVDGTIRSCRIIVFVPDVSKMKAVEQEILEKYNTVSIHYSLKNAKELPSYSTALITVGGIIIGVLFILSLFNLNGNVKQILLTRSRDIVLFHLFGVKRNEIKKIFMIEFAFYSIISFLFTLILIGGLFQILKVFFDFDILTDYFILYSIVDFVISVLLFGILSLIQIDSSIKSSATSHYKEMLK